MNQTPFVSDIQHWGKTDYWATPVEFLSTNGGDCEDYSIAKYFTLRTLGVADDKLRITYVKELVQYNEAHMVLAYFPNADDEPLVLDNINKTILPASPERICCRYTVSTARACGSPRSKREGDSRSGVPIASGTGKTFSRGCAGQAEA